jgi:hypothetical protein
MSRRYYRRRFLNQRGHHAGAYVLADISIDRPRRADEGAAVDANLTIADCGRVATLDFYVHDAAGARNALHKMRILREIVDGFAEALEAAIEDAELRR